MSVAAGRLPVRDVTVTGACVVQRTGTLHVIDAVLPSGVFTLEVGIRLHPFIEVNKTIVAPRFTIEYFSAPSFSGEEAGVYMAARHTCVWDERRRGV